MLRPCISKLFTCLAIGLVGLSSLASGAEPQLGVSDQVRVRAPEWPEINGEFTVGAAGQLVLPLVGRIQAAGLTADTLAHTIQTLLRPQGTAADIASVAVDVLRYRPVYVLGEVQRPGEYPFTPELTVIEAVSLSGGFYRLSDSILLQHRRDAITSEGDLVALEHRLVAADLRIARLKAELAGAAEIRFAPPPPQQPPGGGLSAAEANERLIFAAHADHLAQSLASVQRTIDFYNDELASLRSQIAIYDQEQGPVSRELDQVRSLASKGLAPTSHVTALEQSSAQIAADRQAVEASMIKIRVEINAAELSKTEVTAAWREKVLADLQAATADRAEVVARMGTASEMISNVGQELPLNVENRLTDPAGPYTFTLLRKNGDTLQPIAVSAGEVLLPGDVINVARRPDPAPIRAQSKTAQLSDTER